jgi:ethanolamine utilization protein EutN
MIIGKVIGTVIATRKNPLLTGSKFLIVENIEGIGMRFDRIVAVDNVGAGIGDTVLVATGSAVRTVRDFANAPADALIVGIVDDPSKITLAEQRQ